MRFEVKHGREGEFTICIESAVNSKAGATGRCEDGDQTYASSANGTSSQHRAARPACRHARHFAQLEILERIGITDPVWARRVAVEGRAQAKTRAKRRPAEAKKKKRPPSTRKRGEKKTAKKKTLGVGEDSSCLRARRTEHHRATESLCA